MKLLYLTGGAPDVDAVTTRQLSRIAPQLSVTTVDTAAEALVEIRKLGGFHALLTSPSLAQNETLALIASLRTDRVPIAIVPVVGEAQQDFLASAVGAGADDVLVLRGETLVQPTEMLTRIRQSPHLFPADDRRLRVLYAGSDPVVWDLLEQLPFVRAEQATCGPDGGCAVRTPGAADSALRCDVVLVDEKPNEAHPLQVVKAIKAQASDLPVIVLSPQGAADVSTAAFDLGADDAVLKTSAYRRRLVATLRRVHQRLELTAQHTTLREREARLRQIVETMPEGLTVISGDGTVLAMNAAGLTLVGASRPRDVVGRDFGLLAVPEARTEVRRVLEDITAGEASTLEFEVEGVDQVRRRLELRGVRLERDARGGRGVIATLRAPGMPAAVDLGTMAAPDREREAEALERERALESALGQAESRLRELDDALRQAERRGTEAEAQSVQADGRSAEAEARSAQAEEHGAEADARRAEAEQRRAEADAHRAEADAQSAQADARRAEAERRSVELDAALTAERARWQTERDALASRARHADAAAATLTELQAALEATQAELDRRDGQETDARAAWDAARAELESRVARQAQEAERAVTELRVALALAQAEATELARGRAADRDEHDDERRALEARLAHHLAEERAVWDEARRTLEGRVNEMRVALDTARHELESRQEHVQVGAVDRTDLEAALAAARAELAEAHAGHARVQGEWDEARDYLERRCEELLSAAARQADLAAALDAARAEADQRAKEISAARDDRSELEATLDAAQGLLRQTTTEHKAERARWEAERRELDARLRHATETADGRPALEAALEAARDELRQIAEARSRADADREAARSELEGVRAQLDATRAELEATGAELNTARAERDRATTAHDADRARWQAGEAEREARAAAMAAEHEQRAAAMAAKSEQRVAAVTAESEQRVAAVVAERRTWDEKRRELESRLSDLEALATKRAHVEAALQTVEADLVSLKDAHAADRVAWDRLRQDLERERREADDARIAERHRAELAERLNDERRAEAEAFARERQQLATERARIEESMAALRAAHAEISDALASAVSERDAVTDELDLVRRKLDQEHTRRTLLEAAVREARREAEGRLAVVEAEFVSIRRSLESDLEETSAKLERLTQESQVTRARLEDSLAALSESVERLQNNALFGHAVMTLDGLLVRSNDAFARLFGYLNAREAVARTSGRPFPGLAGRAWLDAKLTAEGRVDQIESHLERIDGRSIRVVESAVIVPDASGEDLVERVLVDRTGSLIDDERLRQAARLEEVGTLVAAMAPDIASLITSVTASGSALADTLPPSDARREHTARILSHATQASDLVRQLAAFSLKKVRPAEPVDLGEAVRRSERLLRPLVGAHVALKSRLGRTEAVPIAQEDLDQLLSALVVAARDLLPIGGALTIETGRVEVDDTEADPAAGLRPGLHLRLSVTATGYGVNPAQPTSALEAVASRAGGHLRVAGEPGRSASLRVYFPRWPGMVGPVA